MYLLVSTLLVPKFLFSIIFTNCSEIGPLYMTYSFTFRFDHDVRTSGRVTLGRERPGSGLKTWNSELFCNSATELILLILKRASGYPLVTFLHQRCTANRSRTMFTKWCTCPNVVAFISTVTAFTPPYTCMHLHFRVPIKIPVRTLHITVSKV